MPRFWREVIIKKERERNLERNFQQNGSFKRSNSYVREKAIQRSQRVGMLAPRRDPRLDRSLFEPPHKVDSPPKSHNSTQPNMKTSIFECSNITENISSDSSSSSFSSASGNDGGQSKNHNSTAINNHGLDSISDSDDDYSFSSFNKRKMMTGNKPNVKRQKFSESDDDKDKVPPITIDLKKRKVTPTKKAKNQSKCIWFNNH